MSRAVVDLEAASARGIAVANLPGANADAVAEHALGLMLSTLRRIPHMHALVRAGRGGEAYYSTYQLTGKTVGLLGCGNIGKRLARMLHGLECKLLACDAAQDAAFAARYGG